jgi:hypothetical protein
MSTSFLGLTVQVELQAGGTVVGKIVSIDQATGSLSIQQRNNIGPTTVTRGEIADLKMVPEVAAAAAAAASAAPVPTVKSVPQASQFKDPAILSYSEASQGSASPRPTPAISHAMQPSGSNLGDSRKATTKQSKAKPSKKAGPIAVADVGTSSRTQTEDEVDFEGSRNGSKSQTKKKKKAQLRAALLADDSDLDEDFDFDKALRTFDKSKIWQEIKVRDWVMKYYSCSTLAE